MSGARAINANERLDLNARMLLRLLQPASTYAALTQDRVLRAQDWDETLALALQHGVAPLLQHSLQSAGALEQLPPHVHTRLDLERRATALDNLRNYGQFRLIARALRQRGIPVIALKGLHLAELIYRDISLRPMGDLDILVQLPDLERSLATLQTLEYGFDSDVTAAVDAMVGIKCNVGLDHRRLDILLEVHWTLAERPYSIPLEHIWRSAVHAKLGDADTMVMSPEFLLLHVCSHLACNHVFLFSLRALCDIAEIVRAHPALDWSLVIDECRRHEWARGIAIALRLAHDQLGAAVPEEALVALGCDTLDPELIADALEHLVAATVIPQELEHAPNLIAVAGDAGVGARIGMFWKRLFLPRAELALIYGIPEHSTRIALYYAVRLRDLLHRYAASAWALNVSDPRLAAVAARHARLAKWIAGA